MRPTAVKLFVYNVGFGDCMLLQFGYADESARHVLIDFGTTKRAPRFRPTSMEEVAHKIAEHCGGKLDMVVATHRHRDHISGFAGAPGSIIRGLEPEVVVQPWTEQPDLAVDAAGPAVAEGDGRGSRGVAARQFAVRLDSLHAAAQQVLDELPRIRATKGVTRSLVEQLEFLGETNLKNQAAVRALQVLGRRQVYASFGTDLEVDGLFPGVQVEVLGPPTLAQSAEIAAMADVDSDEFWHLMPLSGGLRGGSGPRLFRRPRVLSRLPQEARWLIPRIERLQAEELLSLVRILDGVMNNTSLILLFTIGDTLLLFPGDAQLENWRYALEMAPNAADIQARLASTRVYKVGHHGSLNATPRSLLWNRFSRAGAANPDDRLITVLSTTAGAHGHEDHATEVPRRRLVQELQERSILFNTQDCNKDTGWWREVVVQF